MSERDLKFFHANPPRLFPADPHQRPKIEGLLAQLAATEPERYEERLAVYNAMCEEKGLPLFSRITVTKEEKVEEPKIEPAPEPAGDVGGEEPSAEVPVDSPAKKKSKKSNSHSPAA